MSLRGIHRPGWWSSECVLGAKESDFGNIFGCLERIIRLRRNFGQIGLEGRHMKSGSSIGYSTWDTGATRERYTNKTEKGWRKLCTCKWLKLVCIVVWIFKCYLSISIITKNNILSWLTKPGRKWKPSSFQSHVQLKTDCLIYQSGIDNIDMDFVWLYQYLYARYGSKWHIILLCILISKSISFELG